MMEYKDMYFTLFNRISEVIEELNQMQREVEKMYIEASDTKVENSGRN